MLPCVPVPTTTRSQCQLLVLHVPSRPLGTPLHISIDAADNIPLFDSSQNFVLILCAANLNLSECLAHYNRTSISKCVVSQKLTETKLL